MPLWPEADTSIRSGVQRGRVPVLARKPEIVVMGTTACEKCPSEDQKKKKTVVSKYTKTPWWPGLG